MQRSLLLPGDVVTPPLPRSPAVLAKGFRPFFLGAAVFALAIVPLWLLVLQGTLKPTTYLAPSVWHAHEMVFGFVVAVVAGFLLTAVGNWTQRETAVGRPLMLLLALWLLGRLAMAFSSVLPRGVPALLDLAFLPALLIALGRPLIANRNRRNFVMLAILGALLVANLSVHLDALGILPSGSAQRACLVSIDLIALVILIIAGRVFPMFTRNATGVTSIRSIPFLDAATVAAMAVLTGVSAVAPGTKAGAALAGVVGLLAAARALHWGAGHSLRQPLLLILHAGYAWLVVGLLLRAAAGLGANLFDAPATHAVTVGAIGSLTLGMMARVALGHTGRMLAAPAPLVWAFVAINIGAAVRVLGPMLAPGRYFESLVAATAFWAVAFTLFLIVYTPVLLRPRVDGAPG